MLHRLCIQSTHDFPQHEKKFPTLLSLSKHVWHHAPWAPWGSISAPLAPQRAAAAVSSCFGRFPRWHVLHVPHMHHGGYSYCNPSPHPPHTHSGKWYRPIIHSGDFLLLFFFFVGLGIDVVVVCWVSVCTARWQYLITALYGKMNFNDI